MKYFISLLISLQVAVSFSQEKDTIYILFDDRYKEMQKVNFYSFKTKDDPDEVIEKSTAFKIRQRELFDEFSDYDFKFIHFNQAEKAYKIFGGTPPLKIIKDTSFLRTITPLDIEFFRTTDYLKVCKTFEAEDSREQDVVIFMIDKDEIKEGKLLLREVKFSRPAKE